MTHTRGAEQTDGKAEKGFRLGLLPRLAPMGKTEVPVVRAQGAGAQGPPGVPPAGALAFCRGP